MWFLARTYERLGHVQLRTSFVGEFPCFRRYHGGNVLGSYHYTYLDYCGVDVTELRVDQVFIVLCAHYAVHLACFL